MRCTCHFPRSVKQMQGSVNGGATREDLRVQSNIASGFMPAPFLLFIYLRIHVV
ncbi:hypothetical protein AFAE65S_02000 [Alcaligenes phenolicus]|jgi:hypothetical protein